MEIKSGSPLKPIAEFPGSRSSEALPDEERDSHRLQSVLLARIGLRKVIEGSIMEYQDDALREAHEVIAGLAEFLAKVNETAGAARKPQLTELSLKLRELVPVEQSRHLAAVRVH